MEACDHAAMADNSDTSDADHDSAADTSASKRSIRRFVITQKAHTRAWLKAQGWCGILIFDKYGHKFGIGTT